jgi:hypothetical protein
MLQRFIPAVIATLGLGALGLSVPAHAGVVVGIGLPGIAVVVPPVVVAPAFGYSPYFYGRPYYRFGYGYGYGYRGYHGGYGYYGHGYGPGRRGR